jgi:hypothetical protein
MNDETTMVCESCRQRIGDAEPHVMAIERLHTDAFESSESMDGLQVRFHTRCFPEGTRDYRKL